MRRVKAMAALAFLAAPAWAHDTGQPHDEPPGWTLDPWIIVPLPVSYTHLTLPTILRV